MGSVFRAKHLKLGREVAVKFLSPEVAVDADARARFEHEARALALLDHPNIVRVYDFGVEEGESYLVMELVDGQDASKLVPVAPAEAVRIVKAVCQALSNAHQHGVIHRDIKPQNVMVSRAGEVKVTDFGIARVIRPDDSQAWRKTAAGVVAGTAGFMAPELLADGPVTFAVDVYSTGALLRALLTGAAPVGELGTLSQAPRLEPIIRKAMAEQASARFASMNELSDALDDVSLLGLTTNPAVLPPDERLWVQAVAFVQAAAVGAVFWAGLLSLTPRVLLKNDLLPMTVFGTRNIDAEHVMTKARFEAGAVLSALIAVAAAMSVTALLRRHWRLERLDGPNPSGPLIESRYVLRLGVITLASYGLRVWAVDRGYVMGSAQGTSALSFLPFFGGLLLLIGVYFTLLTMLEATRRQRSLLREPKLWLGQGLALIPPIAEFIRTL